jgi:hypothetical protein
MSMTAPVVPFLNFHVPLIEALPIPGTSLLDRNEQDAHNRN